MSTLIAQTFSLIGSKALAKPPGRAAFCYLGYLQQLDQDPSEHGYRFFLGTICSGQPEKCLVVYSETFIEEMHQTLADQLGSEGALVPGSESFMADLEALSSPISWGQYLELLTLFAYYVYSVEVDETLTMKSLSQVDRLREPLRILTEKSEDPYIELARQLVELRALLPVPVVA